MPLSPKGEYQTLKLQLSYKMQRWGFCEMKPATSDKINEI
jgi:hypothetical protein